MREDSKYTSAVYTEVLCPDFTAPWGIRGRKKYLEFLILLVVCSGIWLSVVLVNF